LKLKHFIPSLVIIALLAIVLVPASSASPMAASQPGGLQFVGKALPNGDVAVLYYSAPTGTTIIHRDTVVPVDQISLEIYSPHAGNLTILGEQFQKYTIENMTVPAGNNSTYTSQITVPFNPDRFNSSMQTQTRAFQVSQIRIPQSASQEYVTLTIDNTTLQFYHKTSPDIIPAIFSGLGNLGIALGYTLMGVVVFFLGSITASLLLRRMKFWPAFGKMGWFIILILLLIAMGALVMSAYYQLAYIAWYDWLIPFYVFAALAMLELWPQSWQKLFLVIVGGTEEDSNGDEKDWDVSFPRVARNGVDGSWEYLRPGRREAMKRLFWHIPISFSGSMAKPEGIPLKPNEENLTNLYFLKDFPELKRLPPVERKHLRRRTGKITEYRIPLSAHAQKEVGQFVSELRAVNEFADENENLRKENRDFRIKLENGKVRYNNAEINEISRKIFGANMEFHKGKPETKEEKKEDKQKEESDGRKEK
jgi:hypothetical protein